MTDFERFAALSFDCYGTLIDWETGIAAALRPWAQRAGIDADDGALVSAHGRHETVVQSEMPTTPYPAVLAETMRRIGSDLGAPVTDDEAAAYGRSVGDWPAFADSPAALARLAERFKLIIASNVDRASFARSNERLGVQFDLVVTAEDVGAYKPNHAHFEAVLGALGELGVADDGLCHVAESLYHDHEPAAALGLPSVWIHRRHHRDGFGATATPTGGVEPAWRFTSLGEFAVAAASGRRMDGSGSS